MNLEAFGSIFRFSRENSFIQRNGTFSDTIKFNRGEKLGGTELFPSTDLLDLDGKRAYGRPARDKSRVPFLEVIVGHWTFDRFFDDTTPDTSSFRGSSL